MTIIQIFDAKLSNPFSDFRFENTPYVVDVFEDTPIGSTVLMLFATDLDHGKNAKISYRMLPPYDKFSVERESGALVVSGSLDRESVPTFSLTVIAEDGGISPLADQTEVEISVVDVNDNSPRFSSTIYQVNFFKPFNLTSKIVLALACPCNRFVESLGF